MCITCRPACGNGWIVPACSLPPNAEDVHLVRIVVLLDLSRQMIDILLRDLDKAWDDLASEQPTRRASAKPDLWTAPGHAAAHSKSRTGLASRDK